MGDTLVELGLGALPRNECRSLVDELPHQGRDLLVLYEEPGHGAGVQQDKSARDGVTQQGLPFLSDASCYDACCESSTI